MVFSHLGVVALLALGIEVFVVASGERWLDIIQRCRINTRIIMLLQLSLWFVIWLFTQRHMLVFFWVILWLDLRQIWNGWKAFDFVVFADSFSGHDLVIRRILVFWVTDAIMNMYFEEFLLMDFGSHTHVNGQRELLIVQCVIHWPPDIFILSSKSFTVGFCIRDFIFDILTGLHR